MISAQIVKEVGKLRRKIRSPRHTFFVQHLPYQIQPFMIAPVLPGETMKNLTCTGRVITDPLSNGMGNILPWWHEQYYFYVKLRDLDFRDDVENMLLTGTPLGITDTAQDETYHAGTGVNWVKHCLKRVTEEYFRDEGETWDAQKIGNLPLASAVRRQTNWADNLSPDTGAEPVANNLQNPEGERDPYAEHAEAYQRMLAMRQIDMSFNDFLAMYGVNVPGEGDERDKPELLRYATNWTYPTNVVDPLSGVPSAAAAWSVSERADKDRFFKEPGFIFGVTVARAKIYMGNQRQTAASMLADPFTWLNALHRDRPETALKKFVGPTTPNGPLAGQTNDYWVDVRDLFNYGDQFIAGESGGYVPALPAANGDMRWVTQAMINALFIDTAANKVRFDGVVDLSIASHPTTATDMT